MDKGFIFVFLYNTVSVLYTISPSLRASETEVLTAVTTDVRINNARTY